MDILRIERDRQAAIRESIDRGPAGVRRPRTSARQLVQVTTGGTLPTCVPCVYLGHPVDLDGAEVEGGAGTPVVDTTRTVPFVLLRGNAGIGDIIPIHAVGGRWVGEQTGSGGGGGTGYPCGTCSIPQRDLTVSYTNIIFGNGTAPLTYTGGASPQWNSACTNELLFQLVCTDAQVEFRVYYFVSGSCPGGQSAYCSTIRANPSRLQQDSLTCTPFLLTCSVTSASCPNLASNGYTGFTVSQ